MVSIHFELAEFSIEMANESKSRACVFDSGSKFPDGTVEMSTNDLYSLVGNWISKNLSPKCWFCYFIWHHISTRFWPVSGCYPVHAPEFVRTVYYHQLQRSRPDRSILKWTSIDELRCLMTNTSRTDTTS